MSALALSMISKSVFAFSINPAAVEVEVGAEQTFEIVFEDGEQLAPGSSVQWTIDGTAAGTGNSAVSALFWRLSSFVFLCASSLSIL